MITMNKPSKVATPPRGKSVVAMTPDERIADMQAFGREIRESKKTAQEFLIRAGILNKKGALAKPYRG
ncbi:hypothetical protein MCERE1_02594 [Burkholderiaceae bacterium]|jgi:hypothetical protein